LILALGSFAVADRADFFSGIFASAFAFWATRWACWMLPKMVRVTFKNLAGAIALVTRFEFVARVLRSWPLQCSQLSSRFQAQIYLCGQNTACSKVISTCVSTSAAAGWLVAGHRPLAAPWPAAKEAFKDITRGPNHRNQS